MGIFAETSKKMDKNKEYRAKILTDMQSQYYGEILVSLYRGADKSLARPGRKEARKHVRDERDFNNIETRAAINFFFCKARRRR